MLLENILSLNEEMLKCREIKIGKENEIFSGIVNEVKENISCDLYSILSFILKSGDNNLKIQNRCNETVIEINNGCSTLGFEYEDHLEKLEYILSKLDSFKSKFELDNAFLKKLFPCYINKF